MIIGQRPSTGARRLCTRLECQGRQRTDVRTCTGTNGQTEATRTYCDGLLHRPALFPSPSLTLFPFLPSSPLFLPSLLFSFFWFTLLVHSRPLPFTGMSRLSFSKPVALPPLSPSSLFFEPALSLSLSRLFSCVA